MSQNTSREESPQASDSGSNSGGSSKSEKEQRAQEERRQELLISREELTQEQSELLARQAVQADAETFPKLVAIQGKIFKVDQEIHSILNRTNERQFDKLKESRAQFEKRKTSTPAARRSLRFGDETGSLALQQVIDASSTLSRNLMRIDQCKPAEGGMSISSTVYHRWRDMLLSTVGGMTEQEKESFFRKSAGSNLLDVLEMLPESQLVDGTSPTPFSDIITRLDNFFKSDGIKRAARLELETMKQDTQKNESNMTFLERAMRAAMNCSFPAAEFDERLMNVVAKNSSDRKIREAANEIDRNGKRYTYIQFRDFILHLELFRDNEKLHREEKSKSKQLSMNEVRSNHRSSYQPSGARSFYQRDPSRARPAPYQYQQLGQPGKTCYRCGSRAHDQISCPQRTKTCYKCNREGHMQNMCTVAGSSKRQRSPQPTQSQQHSSKKKKSEIPEIKSDDVNQVGFKSDSTSDSSEG